MKQNLDISLLSPGSIGTKNPNWVEANESFNTLILNIRYFLNHNKSNVRY